MKTVSDLLKKWPADAEFARDTGIDARHVSMMKLRNSIPKVYWGSIIHAARGRGIRGVSFDSLLKIVVTKLKASA